MNKASRGDGIPAELFQILKDDAVNMLHSLCQQIWKIQQWPRDWKRSIFISIPQKGNAKECSKNCTTALISHASKRLTGVQTRFRKGRGIRAQTANICRIIGKARELKPILKNLKRKRKAREFQRNIYFCFIDYVNALKLWIVKNCGKYFKRWEQMGIPDHSTCLLRKLYAGQEATVRTRHGIMDRFKIGKGVSKGCILSPCLFDLYAEYIKRNAGLDES